MSISLEKIQKLREQTMAPLGDIKKALEEAQGDEKSALFLLQKRGKVIADKKASRETKAGTVIPYIHRDGRIGVLLELRCETDFVAKTAEFQILGRDLAMHIAAMKPLHVKPEDISETALAEVKKLYSAQAQEMNKSTDVAVKVIEGKMQKYYDEACLLNQVFVKNGERKVKEIIGDAVAKVGENIEVARFARFEIE